MEYTLNESNWRRARRDTVTAFHAVWFWFYEVCIGAGLTIFVLMWIPSFVKEAGDGAVTVYQVLSPIGGVFAGLIILFLVSLFIAPYKQRNEARQALEKLSQTPLRVECTSFGRELAGKTWLQENQYLWHFNVILTNTSDTQSVSTKAVSLEVRYSDKNGDVRGYALSLIPDVDKDKYGHASMAKGKLLGENEYLKPRDSMRGFYQFTDKEEFWKPKLIQTWPTLVVVDSFDAPHRKEFSQSRFASRSSPDKEVSQT